MISGYENYKLDEIRQLLLEMQPIDTEGMLGTLLLIVNKLEELKNRIDSLDGLSGNN